MSSSLFFIPWRPVLELGIIQPGAQVWFTLTGTNTVRPVYSDSALTAPHANPVVADALGRIPAVYMDDAITYRVRIYGKTAEVGVDTPLEEYDPYIPGAQQDVAGLEAALADDTGAAMIGVATGGTLQDFLNTYLAAQKPYASTISAPPSSLGNHNSLSTAFTGDLTHLQFPVSHSITGATTLGQPTSGYLYTPEAYPHYSYLYNSSGWNNGTADNTGRTAAALFRAKVDQYGQGDGVAYNASVFVNSTRSGSTHYLANPAGVLFNGDFNAGTNGVFGNLREIIGHDNGYDIACGGDVVNLDRTNNTGAKSVWWWGYRALSIGSKAVNNMFNGLGKFNAGLDLAMAGLDFGANKAAISLKADDRIYFNNSDNPGSGSNNGYTAAFNGWYLTYTTGVGINLVANGTSVMQIDDTRAALLKAIQLPSVTASALPTAAAGNKGREIYVTDANSTTRRAAVVGGGANFVKAYSDGASWLIA